MAIFLFLVYPQTESLSESEKDNINTGLELGQGIAELLENKEFSKSLTRISKSVGPSVKQNYHVLSEKDTIYLAFKKRKLSNKRFAKALYKMLAKKYYWRDWIVLIYNGIWGWENHSVRVCGGHIKFRTQGRNIVIASRDRKHSVMNLKRAQMEMQKVAVTDRTGNWLTGYHYKKRKAISVFNSLNKLGACNVSVIKCGAGLHYYYKNRFAYVNRCPYFQLNMWG